MKESKFDFNIFEDTFQALFGVQFKSRLNFQVLLARLISFSTLTTQMIEQ
jgi:hypothetical protein